VAYLEEPRLRLLIKITEMLALMRHGFWLFDSLLPENKLPLRQQISDILKQFDWVDSARHFKELTDKTGNYRKKLEYSEQLVAQLKFERNQFPNPDDVKQVLLSSRFNLMQLDLLELLLSSKIFQDTEESLISLPRFAQQQLSANLAELKQVLLQPEPLSAQQYLSQYQLLIRSLLTGSWFGALFDQDERDDYRDQWLDIKQGIAELQTLMIAKTHLDEVERTDEQAVAAIEKLQPWLDNKVDNLLIALEHSRQMARSIEPYWE
jgi:triphosphatase